MLQILLDELSPRTNNQYSGAWSRFVAFLKREKIPAEKVSEVTVLNYLSSRLKSQGSIFREKGKLAPQSLRTELYGLLTPLWFQFGLAISTTDRLSLSKRFITSSIKMPSSKSDMFPEWDLRKLLTLSSEAFEPMHEKSLQTCRVEAIVLMMLATGRRLEDIQVFTKTWHEYVSRVWLDVLNFCILVAIV